MLSSIAFTIAFASNQTARPHLIFAMIDDWGWYDAGFRNPLIKTPIIDSLVEKEATLLERHYTFKYCSPTRRSFLSGRVPPHSGQDNSAGATVDLRMNTIADKLASAGYLTGQAGKWHAGHTIVQQSRRGAASTRAWVTSTVHAITTRKKTVRMAAGRRARPSRRLPPTGPRWMTRHCRPQAPARPPTFGTPTNPDTG
eukprot:3131865-Prymnesium_polylepis.2